MNNQPEHDSKNKIATGDANGRIGRWMIIGLWLLLLGFGTFFAQNYLDKRARGQTPVNVSGSDGRQAVVLESDRRGHYIVAGQVNGQLVTFLVDTGASGVSLPANVASRLSLQPGRQFPVSTANGTIMVSETRIDTLSIGALTRENVRASINSAMDGEVGLLGMTFLRHFELLQSNDTLTIREP